MSQREIPAMRVFLGSFRHEKVRLFRRQVFDKTVQDIHTGRVFQVKAGIKGQCDVYGYIKGGTPFELEFKSERGKLSVEQERWRDWCREWGVPWLLLQVNKDEQDVATNVRWAFELNEFVKRLGG